MNIFKTKEGDVVIVQKPNIPLTLFFVFWVLSFLPGIIGYISYWVATAYLFYWSYLEMSAGVTTFRKLLGVGVFVYLLYSRFLFKLVM